MAHKKYPLSKWLHLAFSMSLALGLAVFLWLFPVIAGTVAHIPLPTDLSRSAGMDLPLPFGAALVYATNGLTISKIAPAVVEVSEPITYTLSITNATTDPLTRATVADTLPPNIACGSPPFHIEPNPFLYPTWGFNDCLSDIARWKMYYNIYVFPISFTVGSRNDLIFAVNLSQPVPDGYQIVNNNYLINAAGSSGAFSDTGLPVTTTVRAPAWGITKTVSSLVAEPGDYLTYTITISNSGHAATRGAYTLTEVLPVNTVPASAQTQPPAVQNGSTLTWVFTDTLTPNQSKTVTCAVQVTSPLTGGVEIVNQTYSITGGFVYSAAVGAPVTTTIVSSATLMITKIASANPVQAGDWLTYTITVFHAPTSKGAAFGLVISDTLPPEVAYQSAGFVDPASGAVIDTGDPLIVWRLNDPLAVGDSAQVTVTVRMTSPFRPGFITNTFAVSATNAPPVSGSLSTAVTVTQLISVSKSVTPTVVAPGDVVTYTLTITNSGTGIADITLSDLLPAGFTPAMYTRTGLTLPGHGLTPASIVTTTVFTAVTSNTPGLYYNRVITAAYNQTATIVKDTAPVLGVSAIMTVTKTPNVSTAQIGEVITYTYTITNSGDITLTNITLADNRLGVIIPALAVLTPTYSVTATATFLITEALLPGPITNTATVTATYLGVNQVITYTTASVAISYTTRLSVTKTAQPAVAYLGDTITYTYRLTNTGTVTLYTVTLDDDRLGSRVVITSPATLAPGQSAFITAATTAIEAYLPGPLTNTVIVTGVNRLAETTTATATASVPLTYTTAISVLKRATFSGAAAGLGDMITYTYRVTNTGTITLYTVTLRDDRLGSATLVPAPPLGPGQAATALLTTTVVENNLPGPLTNTVAVTGVNILSETTTATAAVSVPLTYTARLTLTKSLTAVTIPARVGDTITYTYRLTNTGSVTLTFMALHDDQLGDITLPITTLKPDDSIEATAVTVVSEDKLPGPLVNTATVTGVNTIIGQNVVAAASASLGLTYTTGLTLTKTTDRPTAAPGDTVVYTYRLTNTGDITWYTISLNDDRLGSAIVPTPLGPGKNTSVVKTTIITEGQLPGPLTNTVVITGVNPYVSQTVRATAVATVTLTYTNAISLQKTANVVVATLGQVITYTYRIINAGNVSLNNVQVVDDKLGQVFTSITPLADKSFTLVVTNYTVSPADFSANPTVLTNTAIVTGAGYTGQIVTDTVWLTVTLVYTPNIALLKTASAATAAPGQTITYTYRITNTGNVTLTSLSLHDDSLGDILLPSSLAPGVATTRTATYVVTLANIPAITNTATVTGSDSLLGQVVTDTRFAVVKVEVLLTAITATNSSPNMVYATTNFTVTTNITSGVTYTWNFGDGAFGSGTNPTHIYTTVGTRAAVVTATNGVSAISATTLVTTTPGPLHHFRLTAISPQTAGVPFPITITAEDVYSNVINTFNQTVTISDTTGTITPTPVTLVNGITITNFTVFSASVATIQAISGTITGSTVVTIQSNIPALLTLAVAPNSIRPCQTTMATATLTDNWLNPISGQTVTIYEFPSSSAVDPIPPDTGDTNAAGAFTVPFRGLAAGSANIQAELLSSGLTSAGQPITVAGPAVSTAITVTVSPGTVMVNNAVVAQAQVGSCVGPVNGAVVTFTVGSLAAIVPPGTAATGSGGIATTTVTAGAVAGFVTITGTVEGPLVSTVTLQIIPVTAPILTITKSANPVSGGQVYPGGAIVYTLIVSNIGTAPATGLVITDTLATGVGFVGGAINSGGGPFNNSGVVTFAVPSLNNGASVSATIQVTVTTPTSGTLLNNTAAAGSQQTGQIGSNLVSHQVITRSNGSGLVYMPIIMKDFVAAPNLISSFTLNPSRPTSSEDTVVVTVIITNVGNAPTGAGFWVDFYVDPNPAPTVANQRWDKLGSNVSPKQGIAWAIPTPGLAPGASIILTSDGSGGGLPPSAPHTVWSGHFPAGTKVLYVYADSFSTDGSPNGGILESNETDNRSELRGLSVTGLNVEQSGLPDPAQLPPRWEP